MHLVVAVHSFLKDLFRLPLLSKLFLLFGAGSYGWKWWKRRQQESLLAESAAWPVYRARVVWAQVSDPMGGGEDGPNYWEGLLTYSYIVPGHEIEIGEHRRRFDDEVEADEWARSLRDTYVDVRVDTNNLNRSVWQESPVLTAPAFGSSTLNSMPPLEPEPWGIRQVAASLVLCASAAGAMIASWIQLSCVLGRPVLSADSKTQAFFAMHIGAMACSIASSFLFPKGRSRMSRMRWRESFPKGSAGNSVLKIAGIYYGVVFTYGWVRGVAHGGHEANQWVVLMFSAGWLLFYLAAMFTSWSAIGTGEHDVR